MVEMYYVTQNIKFH